MALLLTLSETDAKRLKDISYGLKALVANFDVAIEQNDTRELDRILCQIENYESRASYIITQPKGI